MRNILIAGLLIASQVSMAQMKSFQITTAGDQPVYADTLKISPGMTENLYEIQVHVQDGESAGAGLRRFHVAFINGVYTIAYRQNMHGDGYIGSGTTTNASWQAIVQGNKILLILKGTKGNTLHWQVYEKIVQ